MHEPALASSLAALLALGACADAPPPTTPAAPAAEPSDRAPAPPVGPTEDRLPDAVLGTFDATADECGRRTTMGRLTVARDTLDFYYGYAVVDSVAARDGGHEVSATLYHLEGAVEVVPEPVTYRIEPGDGGGIAFGVEGRAPSALVRCDAP